MQMELMPYSLQEAHRDDVEQRLAREANKREINYRQSGGYTVIAYWLMKENVCSIYVEDEYTHASVEYEVPNYEVGVWFLHPLAHKDANFPPVSEQS